MALNKNYVRVLKAYYSRVSPKMIQGEARRKLDQTIRDAPLSDLEIMRDANINIVSREAIAEIKRREVVGE